MKVPDKMKFELVGGGAKEIIYSILMTVGNLIDVTLL